MEKNLGTMVSIDNMPDIVHEPYAFLLDETGVEPIVERTGNGQITLTHLGDRTKMTIRFRLNGRKWQWVKSCLFIDGKSVELARGWDMYVSIFKDPDNGRRNFVPKGAKKAVVPESAPVDEEYLPGAIEAYVRKVRKANNKSETATVTPTVVSKNNQYLVTLSDTETGKKIVFVFGFEGSQWIITDGILINAMGYDVSRYLSEEEFDAFMRELLGITEHDSQDSYLPTMREQGPQGVANSVQVRKATVFRV